MVPSQPSRVPGRKGQRTRPLGANSLATMLYIGTSGWAYPEWRPHLYPEGMGQARFLARYASVFGACEINTTFYGLRPEPTVSTWAHSTPDRFRFTAKVHRRLTHAVRISDEDRLAFVGEFTASLAPLGPRLAVLLWQFPPTRARDDGFLARLLEVLPGHIPSAFEFRHDSWEVPEVEDALQAVGAVRCLAEERGEVPPTLPRGRLAYVRLRADRYGRSQRRAWLDLLNQEGARRDVFAFTKHRDAPAGDPFTGVGLARWLQQRTSRRDPSPAPERRVGRTTEPGSTSP
jgi:uncharacterized protein YecE (DUF72 family)